MAAITSGVLGATSAVTGIIGAGKKSKAAKAQLAASRVQAAEQRGLLQGRERETLGLFGDLEREQARLLNQAALEDVQGSAQLLGLFGGGGQKFQAYRDPDAGAVAAYRAQQAALTQPQTYRGVPIPDDVNPEIFRAVYEANNQFPGGFAGHLARLGPTPDYQDAIQRIVDSARGQSRAQGYKPRSQQAAEIAAPQGRLEEIQVATPEGGDLFARARGESDPLFARAKSDIEQLYTANPLSQFSTNELQIMRDLARPQEQRAGSQLQDRLFAQGRLGTTGGAEELQGFQSALNAADQERQLAAIANARLERDKRLAPQLDLVGGRLNTGLGLVTDKLDTLIDTYSGLYGRARERPLTRLNFTTDLGTRRLQNSQLFAEQLANAYNQGNQNVNQARAGVAAQAGSGFQGLSDFTGGLAIGGFSRPGGLFGESSAPGAASDRPSFFRRLFG